MLQEVNLTLFSISIGALLGAIGIMLVMEQNKSKWIFGYYFLAGISILLPLIEILFNYKSLNSFSIEFYIFLSLVFIIGILLLLFTKKYLDKKFIFSTEELDLPINEFTRSADKSEIKLFGGDLNFLGETPTDIDCSSQYSVLKQQNFSKILILCEIPKDATMMIRYGKILHELHRVELRFYNPNEANLSIRGRMIKIQGVVKLLIFNRLGKRTYETIKTDTGNTNGTLYNNIWELTWSLAKQIPQEQQTEYINLFRNN